VSIKSDHTADKPPGDRRRSPRRQNIWLRLKGTAMATAGIVALAVGFLHFGLVYRLSSQFAAVTILESIVFASFAGAAMLCYHAIKLISEDLAGSEAMVTTVFEGAPFPLTVSRIADGIIIRANEGAHQLLEAEPGSLIGTDASTHYKDPLARQRLAREATEKGRVQGFDLELPGGRWVTLSGSRIRSARCSCRTDHSHTLKSKRRHCKPPFFVCQFSGPASSAPASP
jgi:PAS domain-containing protein